MYKQHVNDLPAQKHAPITVMMVGGGIRFPIFIGALRAIEEKGLQVSKVLASSSGSIIGSFYAAGMSLEEIHKETMSVDTALFKDISIRSMLSRYGLCSGERLESWLDNKLQRRCFADNFIREIQIIATDMLHYRPVIFGAANFPHVKVAVAARASVGVPGVFGYRNLINDGRTYSLVDGSLMAGVVERKLDKTEKTLILKVISKRTLHNSGAGKMSLKRYCTEMLSFFLHAQEKEFIKGEKWKDTILLYCSDIQIARFSLTSSEKEYLVEQGYEQTMKYLEYKWGL